MTESFQITSDLIDQVEWPSPIELLEIVSWFRKEHTMEELYTSQWYWFFVDYNANHSVPRFTGCLTCYRDVFNWLKETYVSTPEKER